MRVAATLLLLVLFLLPATAGALGTRDLPLASDLVERIADPAEALPPTATPIRLAPPVGPAAGLAPQQQASVGARAGLALPQDAYSALVQATLTDLDAHGLGAALYAYGAARGWAPAVAPPSVPAQFEENSTVSYTYDIGDVDRDGVRDLALDVYCTATQGCPPFSQPIDAQGVRASVSTYCGKPHLLQTLSGRDGRMLRNASLDAPHSLPPTASCTIQFVVGTVPLGDGTHGVLVYQLAVAQATALERFQILHDLRLLDMKTGEPVWTFHEEGYLLGYPFLVNNGFVLARNLLVNPILQEAPVRGVSLVPRANPDTLDLQLVSYNVTTVAGYRDGYYFQQLPLLVESYEPDEAMVRLDPASGVELWRVRTFTPGEVAHSVLPRFTFLTPLAGSYPPADSGYVFTMTQRVHDHFWADRHCCFDLTGDGVNDLAAATLEWTDNPSTNMDGLYGLRSRLVVFDGATGERVSVTLLVDDTDAPLLQVFLEPLGDGDGDGAADLLVHVVTFHPTYRHILSVRNGDGLELWRIDSPRELETLVIGDADGDGGNDLLFVEWPDWEGRGTFGGNILAPFTNVTHLPQKVFSGRDGALLWRHDSFGARIDAILLLNNLRNNGIPDLDGNGVAEILTDNPTVLPDRTVLHRLAFIDPRTDRSVARMVTAGAFALPAMAGDTNGDGRDDLALLNGDINDLWLTLHDSDGQPFWSRRIAAPRLSGYAQAIPMLRTHDVEAIGRLGSDLLLNFQLSYTTAGSFIVASSLSQQITGMRGGNGSLVWANPGVYDANLSSATPGASPASALFASALERDAHPLQHRIERYTPLAIPGAIAFALAAAVGFFVLRRLRL